MKTRKLIHITADEDSIYWMPNGHVKCDTCEEYWCKHIKRMLMENLDAASLWEEFNVEFDKSKPIIKIKVPMKPQSGQWVRVTLENAFLAYPSMRVTFSSKGITPILHSSITREEHFIGFIHPSEGRMVIRSMVYDWFRGNVADNVGSVEANLCTSGSHKYRQELQWGKDMNTDNRLAQLWSVFMTGYCLACNGVDLSGEVKDGWDDDLVPEGEKKRESVW